MLDLRELYQDVILDHNRQPRNFSKMQSPDSQARGHNPMCGDELTLYLRLDNDKITHATFQGTGCAISTASASLLTEMVKGKSKEEAKKIFETLHYLLTEAKEEECDALTSQLGKLAVLAGVKTFPARVKCATLAWHTLNGALMDAKVPVSTE